MPDKTKFLSVAVVEKLADELRVLEVKPFVALCGIGESTLHPELDEIIRILAGAGCLVAMTTNGARMTVPLFHTLAGAGLRAINVSLNAATPATHKALMKLPSFERIVETVHELLALRDREYPSVLMHVSMVVCAENEHEVEDFVAYWWQTSINQVWLHPINNRAGLLTGLVRPVGLQRWAKRFAHDARVLVDVMHDRPEGPDLCKIAKTINFVSADGEVRLCAMDYRRQTRYGNLETDSLLTSHHRKLQAFVRGDTRSLCETCDFFP
jgi:MoaA/NifB/PqqE/SkfB family radical SAM enzyme